MSSSSTENESAGRVAFLSADRGSVARLVVVLAFGAAALVGSLVASTSAQFSETEEVGVTFSVPATPTPTPTP